MKLPGLLLVVLLFVSADSFAQDKTKPLSLNDSPIEGQFNYVYQKSSDYEDYKMIKRWHYNRLKTHVLDSIQLLEQNLAATLREVSDRESRIDSLMALKAEVQAKLEKTTNEKNSIAFFGMMLQKSLYNSIVWIIIIAMATGMVLFILLFKRSNSVTLNYKKDLGELQQEFESFRKRALEREESVVRKYHDELLKYKSKVGKLQ
jgi:hypothetical protein